ncbi:MAG: SIS domain-containing protein [bacterium]|nr:SIS domain-containing protein [bacterium]
MIYDDIKNFNKQFEYEPRVENSAKLKKFSKFVVVGMGGSHLSADILKAWKPNLDIIVWNNYGLPPLKESELKERLIITSSYSGNTEETIDACNEAKKRHLAIAVIAAGGKLIRLAQKFKVPYVQMPDMHFQPRVALGLTLKAILALMSERTALREASELSATLRPSREEHSGRDLARRLHGSVPIIYASLRNAAIAKIWKIKFNETGKIPAFCNFLPELNHNEMTGFDVKSKTMHLSKNFQFVFLKDGEDDRRIIKRMNVLERLYHDRGFKVEVLLLSDKSRLRKIFSSLILADWTAYYTAKLYEVEPEQVPMVEEFKKLIGR